MATPTKITDYFPPSPKQETNEKELKEHVTKVIPEDLQKSEKNALSDSSVIITPDPSPHKEENPHTDTKSKTDVEKPGKKSKKDVKPACKKSLPVDPETSKPDTEAVQETEKEDKQKSDNVSTQLIKEPDTKAGNDSVTIDTKGSETKHADKEITQQTTKSKRKGRRKKRDPKTEVQNSPVLNGPAKPKSARRKPSENTESKNMLLTDFFPVRRSDRKSKNEIEKEKTESLHYKILTGVEDGLKVQEIDNKGRGVVATKVFKKGDFVVEYAGDLIDMKEAKNRDEKYSADPTKGCYMYYFHFQNKKYCIDATAESGKLGRLLNHSKSNGNCHTKLVGIKERPYLILAASRDISVGEELSYDYGDRSKASLESHPWLKS